MQIMILTNNDVGLYKFRKELIQQLVKHHKVYICLPYGNFIPDLCSLGTIFIPCELLDRHGTNPVKDLKLILYYKKILRKYKPDLVFTYTIKPNVYGGLACGSLGIPYVVNVTGLGTAIENGGFIKKITLILYKIGLKKAQKVFFQNKSNCDFMVKNRIINGLYDILPGSGVNLNQYKVTDYPEGEVVNFIFVARIMKEKGIDQYLEAAEYIRNKYPKTRFHVCGECEQDYKDKLQEMQNREIINYHGLVRNIAEMHKVSSCTIHPTYYPEGISNVLLESCACGRPIITTNRPGCREVIEDGINGYVIEEKNSKDLIKKIEKFLTLSIDERKQMGLAGRMKVEKEFNRDIVIHKYLDEIRNIK